MTTLDISADTRMADVLASFPGARRALFKGFHVGGCQSCGFAEEDTLAEVARKHDKDAEAMVTYLQDAHKQEADLLIEPDDVLKEVRSKEARLIDLRSEEEYKAHHIDGAELINETFAEEIMAWPKDSRIIMYCRDGAGSLNAVAYMADYGFTRVACVRGGYEALREGAS